MKCKICGTVLSEKNCKKGLCDDCKEWLCQIAKIIAGIAVLLILFFTKNYFLMTAGLAVFFAVGIFMESKWDINVPVWFSLFVVAMMASAFTAKIDLIPKINEYCCQKGIHRWVEIDTSSDGISTLYCPTCKKEKNIETKEWHRMQADKKYD